MVANKEHAFRLVDIAPHLVGQRVRVQESISRSRQVGGHDRHFATQTQFMMDVRRITTLLSGAQIQFDDGAETWYGIALDAVVHIEDELPQQLTIIEQFEQATERRTMLVPIEQFRQ